MFFGASQSNVKQPTFLIHIRSQSFVWQEIFLHPK